MRRPNPVRRVEPEASDEADGWRRVRIDVTVTVARANPTAEAEARDARAQLYLQQILAMDMEDRAAKLEVLLNQAASTL